MEIVPVFSYLSWVFVIGGFDCNLIELTYSYLLGCKHFSCLSSKKRACLGHVSKLFITYEGSTM